MPDIYFSILLPSQFLPFSLILSAAFILPLADLFLSLQPAGLAAASWWLPGQRDPLFGLELEGASTPRYSSISVFFLFFLFLPSLCCSQFFQASLFGVRQGRGGWGRVVRGIQKV